MKRAGILLVLLAAAAPCVPAASGLSRAEQVELVEEANGLFRRSNETAGRDPEEAAELTRRAIMRYKRILREGGIENGYLYYNIGNAYFRLKDIGRAILNYRRAAQYIPDDPDLQQNLGEARARRRDRIEVPEEKRILKTLFFWHYDVSTRSRSVAFVACFLAAWLAAGVRLFVRRPFPAWAAGVAAVLAVALVASLLAETAQRRSARPGVVLSERVVARKGNGETYEPSFRDPLHAGTEFEQVETRGHWIHVELADGRRCWLPRDAVALVR